ncbi:type VII secretion protein EssA [Bacillus sonorensis]|uniref:type VII secretion protein EssA n=1 Tax=Bacillus sonorensis TaxID=119858 RepID=UPI001F013C7E|nr:type VII secretion protein EssA [Bacillus sonorensis]MCF7616761.1 type VII secretion protein EssA [Bacillus sonorensis]MCY8033808.1 type VII secretion protein EssA [Bacillus sonorensis]MCY8086136.1 type VII secretion protein EssA [Bacillus sonorensis]MCY8562494.1 type VII secretion protein EssA [Bacillus sonorensis]MCZ0068903.1 type VII secretion protein EssA [Bacillus sonorensis]
MRRNANWGKKGIMAIMLSFFLFTPLVKAEETDNVDVKPNEYKRQDIEVNTDYIQEEEPEYKEDITIPEELKNFSFKETNKLDPKEELKEIFTVTSDEPNTVVAQLKQLNLSFDSEPSRLGKEDTDSTDQQSLILPILYGVLILLGIAGLFFLIPRIAGQQKK